MGLIAGARTRGSRRRGLVVLPAAVIGLSAAIAGPGQAAGSPHWFAEGQLVVGSVVVKSKGTLTFSLSGPAGPITCKLAAGVIITNPSSGGAGTDEVNALGTHGCKGSGCPSRWRVVAKDVPWHSHLVVAPSGSGVRDVIEGVALEPRCREGSAGTFTGTLEATVGNSVLEFSGQLSGPGAAGSGQLSVGGSETLRGPKKQKKITAA